MKIRVLVSSVLVTSSFVAACVSDDFSVAPSTVDAGPAAPAEDTSPAPTVEKKADTDAGIITGEEDGGLISDAGGGNPDEEETDAGAVVDAGADGGAAVCGPQAGNGAALASTCSSTLSLALGGTITPGSYDLTGFTVTGDIAYCGTYKSSSYSGRLDITADGDGFILAERVAKVGVISLPNKSFTAKIENKFLKVTQTCGAKINSTSWGYTLTTTDGKPTIIYTHDSGTATVRYRWVLR